MIANADAGLEMNYFGVDYYTDLCDIKNYLYREFSKVVKDYDVLRKRVTISNKLPFDNKDYIENLESELYDVFEEVLDDFFFMKNEELNKS